MLAEPRRKQKYSLNPRGLDWSNDDSKFGQKLMERMGWKKGKGLGANEDGNQHHISVSTRIDNRGVGCTKQHSDNWLSHQEDFASILASLNTTHVTTSTAMLSTPPTCDLWSAGDTTCSSSVGETRDAVSRLEEKSKSSRRRVHYKKFTKGKDLSLCRNDDLDCILGRRAVVSTVSQPVDSKVAEDKTADEESEEKNFGVTTVTSSTSISDYFASKMMALKRVHSAPSSLARTNHDEVDNKICDHSELGSLNNVTSCHQSEDTDDVVISDTSTRTKIKKNKKNKTVGESSQPLLDVTNEKFEGIVTGESRKKNKKKNKPIVESVESVDTSGVVEINQTLPADLETQNSKMKKKKEKRKRVSESECEVKEEKNEKEIECTVNEFFSNKGKKKKCKEIQEETKVDESDVAIQEHVRMKEESKRRESKACDDERGLETEDVCKESDLNESSRKKKKNKKAKKNKGESS